MKDAELGQPQSQVKSKLCMFGCSAVQCSACSVWYIRSKEV